MTTPDPMASSHAPILVELDEQSWASYLDSTEKWLDNVMMVQSGFHALARELLRKISEPHILALMNAVEETAARHVAAAEGLYGVIGRDPSRWRKSAGTLAARARSLLGDAVGAAGGAAGPWHDMQQLFLSNVNAMSAFAAAEQLGYSLGLPELAERCFDIVAEKHAHHLMLQELLLEMVPRALLYKVGF